VLPAVFCFCQQVRAFAYFFIFPAGAARFFLKDPDGSTGGCHPCIKVTLSIICYLIAFAAGISAAFVLRRQF
jgi:hypothetical protein